MTAFIEYYGVAEPLVRCNESDHYGQKKQAAFMPRKPLDNESLAC